METEAIAARVAPALAELGLECLGVEWNAGHGGGLLRVYIDSLQHDVPLIAGAVASLATTLDPCSSASTFDGWRERFVPTPGAKPLARARTWLLTTGWKRHGPIPIRDS